MKTKNIKNKFFYVKETSKKGTYAVYEDDKIILTTPADKKVSSGNKRLLNLISDELNALEKIDPHIFNYYSIFSIYKDFIPNNFDKYLNNIENALLNDPTLKTSAGPEAVQFQFPKWSHLLEFLSNYNIDHPQYIQLNDYREVKNWIYDRDEDDKFGNEYIENHELLVNTMKDNVSRLDSYEKSTLIALTNVSGSLMYSYLIVKNLCLANEFSNAVFAGLSYHPKMYDGELNESKIMIEELTKFGNAIKVFLSVAKMKNEKDTWLELDELRKKSGYDLDLSKIADLISENIDYELFIDYMSSFHRGLFLTPTVVAKLMAGIAKTKNPKRIADICSGLGNISRFLVFADVDGYEINRGAFEVAKKLLPTVKFHNQCIINTPINESYDMVIGHLPFNARFQKDGKTEQLENLAILKGLEILNADGSLVLLVPISFLYSSSFKHTRDMIIKDHSLEQVIELPKNIYKHTSMQSAILLINKNSILKSTIFYYFELNPSNLESQLIKRGEINKKHLKEDWNVKFQRSNKDVKNFFSDYKITSEKKKISEVAYVINGYAPKKEELKDKGDFLILSGKNIKENSIIKTKKDKYIIGLQNSNKIECILQPGDIIITTIFENIKIYEYKESDIPAIASNNVKIIRSDDDYLGQYFSSKTFYDQFKADCKSRLKGSAIPYITKKDLENIEIYKIPLKILIEEIESYSTKKLSKDSLKETVLENIKDVNQKAIISEILDNHFEDPILKLSKGGESIALEFKSSYRTNTQKPEKPPKVLQHSVVKTVAAFANTKGGDLLIGVSDHNEVIGVEIDNYKDIDTFIRTVTRKLESDISPNPISISDLINFSHLCVNDKTIVRVNVKPSTRPLYAYIGSKKEGETFYQRKTASSEPLSIRETVRYIKERFPDHG